jgi:hypothetical protein
MIDHSRMDLLLIAFQWNAIDHSKTNLLLIAFHWRKIKVSNNFVIKLF